MPAGQGPVQLGEVVFEAAPNVPAGHGPVHEALASPDDRPNRPAGQGLHAPAPDRL